MNVGGRKIEKRNRKRTSSINLVFSRSLSVFFLFYLCASVFLFLYGTPVRPRSLSLSFCNNIVNNGTWREEREGKRSSIKNSVSTIVLYLPFTFYSASIRDRRTSCRHCRHHCRTQLSFYVRIKDFPSNMRRLAQKHTKIFPSTFFRMNAKRRNKE